jgi:hypothetical protein
MRVHMCFAGRWLEDAHGMHVTLKSGCILEKKDRGDEVDRESRYHVRDVKLLQSEVALSLFIIHAYQYPHLIQPYVPFPLLPIQYLEILLPHNSPRSSFSSTSLFPSFAKRI